MKIRWAVLAGMGLLALNLRAQNVALKSPREKLSYALGMDLGSQLKRQGVEIDPDLFAKALKDVLAGQKTLMTEEEGRVAIAGLQNDIKNRVTDKNRKEGEAFLAANKGKEGV